MKPALRLLLTLFTILCSTTISSASIQESQEGVVFGKACNLEEGVGFCANFNAPNNVGRPHLPGYLPDDAPVIRGGQSLPDNYTNGSGVTVGAGGKLDGVSVQSSGYKTASEMASGIPHKQMGQTTVGDVRRAGGDVIPSPNPRNPDHATLSGVTGEGASMITRPTNKNPNPRK